MGAHGIGGSADSAGFGNGKTKGAGLGLQPGDYCETRQNPSHGVTELASAAYLRSRVAIFGRGRDGLSVAIFKAVCPSRSFMSGFAPFSSRNWTIVSSP